MATWTIKHGPFGTGVRACILGTAAMAAWMEPSPARAQEQLETITVEGANAERAANSQGTGAGEANEQQGFVARRSGSVTKTNTPLIETPQSVSVITSDQIERQEVRTIRAATRYSSGVTPEVTGGADTRFGGFNIRGFDATANSSFIDGLRLPSTASINFFGLDPYGAERIEILKGPASVLFGQNGPGGLVNYVTKRPTATPLREIEINGGSFGLIEGRFDLSGPAGPGSPFGYRLSGVVRNSQNQVDFVDDDRIFIAPVVTWDPDAATSLTISGIYQRDRAGWGLQFLPASGTVYPNLGRRIPLSRFLGEPAFDYYDTDIATVGYQFSHQFNGIFTFRQNARYSYVANDQASVYGAGYVDEQAGLLGRSAGTGTSRLGTFSIDNQLQAAFGTGPLSHTVLAGLDYRRTNYDDLFDTWATGPINVFNPVYGSPVSFLGVYSNRNVKQDQVGLYLQDQIKFDKLSLLLSGRHDWADTASLERLTGDATQKSLGAFTGRAGLIYNFDNGVAPFVTYSESFLPPLDISATGELFNAETGRQWEAGVKYQPLGWNALFTASAFNIVRDNAIRYDRVGGTFQARQTGQITSNGFELEGVAGVNESIDLRFAYTYLDVEITKDPDGGYQGRVPVTVPKHSASAWVDYTIRNGSMLDGLGVGLGIRYVGSSFGDDANTFKVPAATVLDAALSYKRANYEVALNASNLFDKEYVASCGNREFYCFYAEGRRLTAKATIRW